MEDGIWRGLTAKEQRILQAFQHWVHKNHPYTPTCYGCVDAAAWLSIPGYQGEMASPLVH